MSVNERALCPQTGLHCEAREYLLELQAENIMTSAVVTSGPNVITDNTSRTGRILMKAANLASSSSNKQQNRNLAEFNNQIGDALAAELSVECEGALCGTNLELVFLLRSEINRRNSNR